LYKPATILGYDEFDFVIKMEEITRWVVSWNVFNNKN